MNTNVANYAVVPASVRYDRRLSPNAILLYMEISAIMHKDGVAWEKSDHYVEIFQTSRSLILKWLNELKVNGHVFTFIKDGNYGISFTPPAEPVIPVEAPKPKPKLPEPEEERLTIQWVVDEYHRICTSFAKVRTVTDARRKAIKARWIECGKKRECFTEVFTKAQGSKFLRADIPGQKWKADFDFLTSPSGFAKTLEGKYTDGKKQDSTEDDGGEL